MPVHNTGRLLLESVRSVLAQSLFVEEGDAYWELLIVDDASTDPGTREALDEARALSPSIRVLPNRRSRGAAGARNTGVFAARGSWVGFLDSDDLWYPFFLSRLRDAFIAQPDARWRAAHFDVGDDAGRVRMRPLSERSPCLHAVIAADYDAGRVSTLRRAVDVLLRCGCLQVMTVQITRNVLVAAGGFDETLTCAEDYDLWVRLANVEPLYLAPLDAGIYRVRHGSLTKSGRPMYYGEDQMLRGLRQQRAFDAFRNEIDERLVKVYDTFCFHYRAQLRFAAAACVAARLIGEAPGRLAGWKHLMAATLRR